MSGWASDHTRPQLDTPFDQSMYVNQQGNFSYSFDDNPLAFGLMQDFCMSSDHYPTLPSTEEYAPLAHVFDAHSHHPGDGFIQTDAFLPPGQFIPNSVTFQPTTVQDEHHLEYLPSPSTVTMPSPDSVNSQLFGTESGFERMEMTDATPQPVSISETFSPDVRAHDRVSMGNDHPT